jgi:hypothetical protein
MQESTLMLPEPSASAPVIGQALLFSPEIEVRLEDEESRGRYTAERALVKRPGLKEAVIKLRAQGEGYLSIASKLNCHHMTASAIAAKFPEEIDIERAKRVSRLRSAADKLVELIDSNPESVPPGMRALAASQLYDKGELLDGRATARIEKREEIDIYAHWDEVKEKLLDPGDVTELPAPTGLPGGNVPAIEAPVRDMDPASEAASEAGSDAQSLVSPADHEVTERADTASATGPSRSPGETGPSTDPDPTAPDARNRGGRGSALAEGGGLAQSGYTKRNFSGNGPQPPPI